MPAPNPAAMFAPTPEALVQMMPSRQRIMEQDALNGLEAGTGEKAHNDVVKTVKAGEGEGRCNPILVSPKSNQYKFKSNHGD